MVEFGDDSTLHGSYEKQLKYVYFIGSQLKSNDGLILTPQNIEFCKK